MKAHTLEILEFNEIKKILAGFTVSEPGKLLINNIKPAIEIDEIKVLLDETTEGRFVYSMCGGIPLQCIPDTNPLLLKARFEGTVLEGDELYQILTVLEEAQKINNFFKKIKEHLPLINERTQKLHPMREFIDILRISVNEKGEILDSASHRLKRIREKLGNIRSKILQSLNNILNSPSTQKAIQEKFVTIRHERYVIPVKSEYQSTIPGIVHDRSSSGVTLFIEPESIVGMNNMLLEMSLEERDEIIAILTDLTNTLRRDIDKVNDIANALAELDLINAKATIAEKLKCIVPQVKPGGAIKLYEARHPLLVAREWKTDEKKREADGQRTVAVDLFLGDKFNTLIVTGPNAGGKTVALKTLGLLILMAQSGLHIPAREDSEIPIFKKIYAIIGDEQSIMQNLSTFSSQIFQINEIIGEVDSNSLVLFDELGAGTDPVEGAALGISIIEFLSERGAKIMATTHLGGLKDFASHYHGAENASVEFDQQKLQPTFRLSYGKPGSSYALTIASRFGIHPLIIEKAKENLPLEHRKMDELLSSLEQEKLHLEELNQRLQKSKDDIDSKEKEAASNLQATIKQKEEIIKNAYLEAEKIINEARRSVNQELTRLEEEASRAKLQRVSKSLFGLKEKISDELLSMDNSIPPSLKDIADKNEVYIPSLKIKGVLVEPEIEPGIALIQSGTMKIKIPHKELRPVEGVITLKKYEPDKKISYIEKEGIPSSINLIGKRAKDAIDILDKYLDDAYLAGLSEVTLVHGKGSGTLKKAITEALKESPLIESYKTGDIHKGGTGVTIAVLKDKTQ